MSNRLVPLVDQWYRHRHKGQCFCVTAVDRDTDSIEAQHFDGDLEEYTFGEWRALDIERCEEPENWAGPMDIADPDDFGTQVSDTSPRDWHEQEDIYPVLDDEDGNGKDRVGTAFLAQDLLSAETARDIDATFKGLTRCRRGVYEESFDDGWYAEYSKSRKSGLWRADVFRHDVLWRHESGFTSLTDARGAVQDFYLRA